MNRLKYHRMLTLLCGLEIVTWQGKSLKPAKGKSHMDSTSSMNRYVFFLLIGYTWAYVRLVIGSMSLIKQCLNVEAIKYDDVVCEKTTVSSFAENSYVKLRIFMIWYYCSSTVPFHYWNLSPCYACVISSMLLMTMIKEFIFRVNGRSEVIFWNELYVYFNNHRLDWCRRSRFVVDYSIHWIQHAAIKPLSCSVTC